MVGSVALLDEVVFYSLLSLVFFCPLLISPWGFDHPILIKDSFLLFTSGILLLVIFLRAAAERRLSLKGVPLGKPILFLLAFAFLSLFRAVNIPAALHRLGLLMAGVSLFYVTTCARLNRERIAVLARAAVASALIATAYAFLQFLRLDPFYPPTVALASTLGNRNFLGEYLAFAIPLCLGLSLSSEPPRGRQLYGLAALFLFSGLLLTRAKGAALGSLFSLALFAALVCRRKGGEVKKDLRRLLPFAILALAIAGFLGFAFFSQFAGPGGFRGILERYATSQAVYFKWRLVFYGDSLRMALDNSLLGVGIGNFQSVYPLYRTMPESLDPGQFILDHAHNDYLEFWAELGLGGLLALLWLLWAFFKKALDPQNDSVLSSGYAASVGALAVNSLFAFGLYNPAPFAAFWISMALALRLRADAGVGEDQMGGETSNRMPPVWALLLVVPLVGVLLYASVKPLVADVYLFRGYRLLVTGWPGRAVPFLERAARLSPGRLQAHIYLGEADFYARRHREAITVLTRYLTHDPYNYQIHYLLGLNAEQAGDEAAALKAYERARTIYPLYSKPLLRIGVINERRGHVQGAIAAYRQAIRLNPGFHEVINNLGILLSNQGRLDEAVRVWEEGAKESPEDATIAQNLAIAYSKKGERQKALAWEQRAEQLRRKDREGQERK